MSVFTRRSSNTDRQARRRARILWFQYEISFAAYCFDWWEKLIVLAVLLSVLFLVSYGVYRQGAALYHRLGALPAWCAPPRLYPLRTW